jgi:hypothetical protein
MGKHSPRKLYLLFAAWTFLAVVSVTVAITIFRFGTMQHQEEKDIAEATSGILLPVLGVQAGGLSETELRSFEDAAGSLLGDEVRTIRLWSSDGELLASASLGEPAAATRASISEAARGELVAEKRGSLDGEVLSTFDRLASGAVLEAQIDYDTVTDAVGAAQRDLVLTTAIATIILLSLIQLILWAATRGLRGEYDRLLYLYRSGQGIRSTLDVTDVLEQLAHDAALYTRAQFGMTVLVEEKRNDLLLKASFDRKTDTTSHHHRKVEEWFLRRCAATGETVVAKQDRLEYQRLLGYEPEEERPVNIVCVPIPGRDAPIGVLGIVRDRRRGRFRANEVQMIEEMAAQAAMAVEQSLLFAKMRSYADEVELSYDNTLKVLMAALDTKDATTQGHSERVSRLTVALAKEMSVPDERLVDIERGALLHDVGKIGVPDEVLRKPDTLNEGEWEAMQKHPLLAGLMVSKVGFLEGALPILLYHHERYDGSGYPFGLQADAIPLEARIFAVVDSWDAMTSDRPYRQAMPVAEALEEIRRNAGIQFDPEVVQAFTRVLQKMQPQPHTKAA